MPARRRRFFVIVQGLVERWSENAVGCSNGDVTANFGGRVFITTLFPRKITLGKSAVFPTAEGGVTQNVTRCRRTAESMVISEGCFVGDVRPEMTGTAMMRELVIRLFKWKEGCRFGNKRNLKIPAKYHQLLALP